MRRSPIPGLVLADGWLAPFEHAIKGRMRLYDSQLERICRRHGSLMDFAGAYKRMGFNRDAATGEWVYREWAPGARQLYLIGDFNFWNREANPMQRGADGVWEIRLPGDALKHGQHVKVHVVGGAHRIGVDSISV